jgi:hypothetical protein
MSYVTILVQRIRLDCTTVIIIIIIIIIIIVIIIIIIIKEEDMYIWVLAGHMYTYLFVM